MQIRIGMVFRGYCAGYFGRDGYGPKRVEAFGADWIVARAEDGIPIFARIPADELDRHVEQWLVETVDEY